MPSLLEALERKYFAECEFENANEQKLHRDDNVDVMTAKCGQMEFSIFIPRLSPLTYVPELLVLNDCDIDCAGNFDSIKEKCQRVRELDLAQNKLNDWQEVFHILKHMPRIEFLNLSKNQLMGPISRFYAPPINNLKNIVLNGTYLDWLCVKVLLENLPILEELHLSLNNFTEVLIDIEQTPCDNDMERSNTDATSDDNCCNANSCYCQAEVTEDPAIRSSQHKCRNVKAHHALKTLHFTGNPIESWREICRLGRVFPNMENLVLADCPIKSLQVDREEANAPVSKLQDHQQQPQQQQQTITTNDDECANETHTNFSNLKFLNLSYADLSTWHDIDQLALFPKLKNLRVKNWPLWESLECTEHERRQLLIARLPHVITLNGGGVISADEREDAERSFIRYYMERPECERPKRYMELLSRHGKLDPLVNVNLKPDKRIKVNFTYNDVSESRLVDVYLTVADLKGKLEKLVGLPANKMRLFYLDQDYKELGPEEMRFPNKKLYSYNIQAGDEIIVDIKK